MINRIILIVIDSMGIGELPDADKYGDMGANTLENLVKYENGINIPNLINLGLANIDGISQLKKIKNPIGSYGRSNEVSQGKDTTTGHWEIAGIHLLEPFRTFPNGFPKDVIYRFEKSIGRKVLGNKVASGTKIIEELGEEHIKTGYPIVYTSADSVFQIAAHEDIIPLKELYEMCQIARKIMLGENTVARIIARPFIGDIGNFIRTSNRKDFSLNPPNKTILDYAKMANLDVVAIGKIEDIFNKQGITESIHTLNNMDGIDRTIEYLKRDNKGIIFTNLVDFDSQYGHRRDTKGYKNALEEMDKRIPEILDNLNDDDVLIFTADHGNDPTFKGTDHTREYIPILIYGYQIKSNINIGTRKTFSDIAATISDMLNIPGTYKGISFKNMIVK